MKTKTPNTTSVPNTGETPMFDLILTTELKKAIVIRLEQGLVRVPTDCTSMQPQCDHESVPLRVKTVKLMKYGKRRLKTIAEASLLIEADRAAVKCEVSPFIDPYGIYEDILKFERIRPNYFARPS